MQAISIKTIVALPYAPVIRHVSLSFTSTALTAGRWRRPDDYVEFIADIEKNSWFTRNRESLTTDFPAKLVAGSLPPRRKQNKSLTITPR